MIDTDREWMLEAIAESRLAPPVDSAFAVGALVVTAAGEEVARGHSRQRDPADHAEEVALDLALPRLRDPGALAGATLYSSLEPCTRRRSRLIPCTQLVIASGIRRVVVAAREPELFADCDGVETLAEAGVEVVELEEMAGLVRAVNAHLDWPAPARR